MSIQVPPQEAAGECSVRLDGEDPETEKCRGRFRVSKGNMEVWWTDESKGLMKLMIPQEEWREQVVIGVDTVVVRATSGFEVYVVEMGWRYAKAILQQTATFRSVDPVSFYGLSQQGSRGKLTVKSFSRQENAFQYCDENPTIPLKLFTYESAAANGRRRFLVADLQEFYKRYAEMRDSVRHVYEIIREASPCRLYFDLEFSRELNPQADGEAMVSTLVDLVCWKLYDRFGLFMSRDYVVDLESSNGAKFSRHLIFILRPTTARTRGAHTAARTQEPHLQSELLFLSNADAGAFVADACSEMLQESSDAPKAAFAHLWVLTSTDGQKQCFVDRGVYTRNRAFRLALSCKYGKSTVLRLSDSRAYSKM
jgi:hypothetical protein